MTSFGLGSAAAIAAGAAILGPSRSADVDAKACRKAQATVDKMLAKLQSEMKKMTGNDYLEAKQFLTSVKNDIVTSPRAVFIAAR